MSGAQEPTVSLPIGTLEGAYGDGLYLFKGVPYAARLWDPDGGCRHNRLNLGRGYIGPTSSATSLPRIP